MPYRSVDPAALVWATRPHADDEPARHVAELSEVLETAHLRANIWRYEPGAAGRRHVHAEQEEIFVVLSGTLTMYLGESPERVDVPAGGLVHVAAGTPLQTANHGADDLVVFASGYPPDDGAELLESAIA
jgi:mannose-6-phosphate isomerase-like protein (cupin superfamily)